MSTETTNDLPTGPNGCDAAIAIRGEHFWCDSKAPHRGWPHGSTAAETVWKGTGASEDASAAWSDADGR